MNSTWEEIRKKAKKQTDDAFASKISALGEIEWVKLLPAPLEAGQSLTEANPT